LPAHSFGGCRYRPHWHKRLDAGSHYHPFAVRLLPEIVPMPGLPELEPAALGRSPHDCGLEYFDRPRWSWLHANSTGKARAPCFRSKAAIAGLNQRGVSQALTGIALPALVCPLPARRNRQSESVTSRHCRRRLSKFTAWSEYCGDGKFPQLPSPPCREFEGARRPPNGASSCAVINL
jgi:hypothetical protein